MVSVVQRTKAIYVSPCNIVTKHITKHKILYLHISITEAMGYGQRPDFCKVQQTVTNNLKVC
jgi:hypothetical protein